MNQEEASELPCKDKLVFNTQREARGAATVALYQHGTKLKVYICKYCGLWHLSSDYSSD